MRLGLRLGLRIPPREVVLPAAAASAQSQQSEKERGQKSADTKLPAFHENHSLLFVMRNLHKYNPLQYVCQ